MSTTTLQSFCQGAEQILNIESAITQQPIDAEMVKKLAFWKTGMFRIVVMGEIKKGKSSFVNALLGTENLVPVSDDVATSTVYKICYGDKPKPEYRVFFTEDSGKPVKTIAADEVESFGTEKGNPGNEKQVEFIQVLTQSPLLKDGLVIIDTPGLGGIVKSHKKITYEYVPKSDAVFVITESGSSPLGALEVSLLADLKKVTKYIYFVQTKSSTVKPEEAEMRKERNLTILSENGFNRDAIKYFVVDSAIKCLADELKSTAELARSGFDKVSAFINQYIRPNVQRLVLERACAAIKPKIDMVGRIIADREKVLGEMTEEARTKLKDEITEAQNQVEAWERDVLPTLQDEFERGLQIVQDEARTILEKCQPQAEFHSDLMSKIDAATDLSELQQISNTCDDSLPEFFTTVGNKLMVQAKDGVEELLNQFAQNCLQKSDGRALQVGTSTEVVPFVTGGGVGGSLERFETKGFFDAGRTAVYGGFAGMAIAGVVGGAIGSVVPVVGTIIGSELGMLVAGLWGAKKSVDIAAASRLDGAKNSLKSSITAWMTTNSNKFQSKFNSIFANLRLSASSQVRSLVRTARKEMRDNLERLTRTGKEQMEATKREHAELLSVKAKFGAALNQMGASANA